MGRRCQVGETNNNVNNEANDVGRYPTTEEGLAALMTAPPSAGVKWNGPYLKKAVPLDPWGNAYQYRAPGARAEYEVLSLGKDGQPGGAGENADITSN